jgi:hypothetical protein
MEVPFENRPDVFLSNIKQFLEKGMFEECRDSFSKLEFSDIPRCAYDLASNYIKTVNKRIVASFDPLRVNTADEIVIVYGNYPDWHLSLPCSHILYRNVSLFFDTQHDVVEYHPCWELLDCIYILNLKSRPDRLNDVMISLCHVRAPLHRIKVVYGVVNSPISPHAACTEGHVNIINMFKESGKDTCMVLEDDIVFLDDVNAVWKGIGDLLNHCYNYNVCFLAVSKFGRRESRDSVFSITRQPCTTASAYILNKKTIEIVSSTVNEGLRNMKNTGDFHTNCIDRYWSKLDDMVYLKKKIAFQRPSWSSTRNCVMFNLD